MDNLCVIVCDVYKFRWPCRSSFISPNNSDSRKCLIRCVKCLILLSEASSLLNPEGFLVIFYKINFYFNIVKFVRFFSNLTQFIGQTLKCLILLSEASSLLNPEGFLVIFYKINFYFNIVKFVRFFSNLTQFIGQAKT